MRLLIAASILLCGLITSPAMGETTFPYKAYISADDVYVRSGPGQSYYPTTKLKSGAVVEVYRHDPGGWYAIRPPQDSFTWVSGRYLQWNGKEPKIPGPATVNGEGVAARVGTKFSDVRDVIQFRLNDLEPVWVLEAKRSTNGSDAKVWYKIAPPQGEFRWIFGKYLTAEDPQRGLRETSKASNPILEPDSRRPDPSYATEAIAGTRTGTTSRSRAVEPDHVRPLPPDRVAVAEEDFQHAGPQRALSPEEYRKELEDIDMALSRMVVEEPTVWHFEDLQRRAETLLNQAQTAPERGRARVLTRKLSQFDGIRRRYAELNTIHRRADRANRLLANREATVENREGRDEEGRFDGVGRLTEVNSSKPDAPRYALMDSQGKVRCYVSAAPGVRLHHYVNRRIGINGNRGYMLEQRAEHVMAKYVRLLDGGRLR